jgi:hypothetical protein
VKIKNWRRPGILTPPRFIAECQRIGATAAIIEKPLCSPTGYQMHYEHDNRHHENDVDESPSDVKAKAKRPEENENDADDCEHKSE